MAVPSFQSKGGFTMIGLSSELTRINDSIKLFGISPTEIVRENLLKMWDELTTILPEKSNILINFFKDGETYHGEAVLGFLSVCILSRQTSNDLSELSLKMKTDNIKKLNRSNSGNGWEGNLQLSAI